jgi:hypothetical protein
LSTFVLIFEVLSTASTILNVYYSSTLGLN